MFPNVWALCNGKNCRDQLIAIRVFFKDNLSALLIFVFLIVFTVLTTSDANLGTEARSFTLFFYGMPKLFKF